MSELFARIDRARLARHEKLIELWKDLPADELLCDLNVLAQMAAFRHRQELLVSTARVGVAQGATHDCGEWKDAENRCQVCGRAL